MVLEDHLQELTPGLVPGVRQALPCIPIAIPRCEADVRIDHAGRRLSLAGTEEMLSSARSDEHGDSIDERGMALFTTRRLLKFMSFGG